jgi:hypothetical protein
MRRCGDKPGPRVVDTATLFLEALETRECEAVCGHPEQRGVAHGWKTVGAERHLEVQETAYRPVHELVGPVLDPQDGVPALPGRQHHAPRRMRVTARSTGRKAWKRLRIAERRRTHTSPSIWPWRSRDSGVYLQ